MVVALAGAPAAQSQLGAALHAQSGWAALAAGEPRAAADAFARALAAEPTVANLHLGAALAAYAERRDEDARAAAERALALETTLWRAREVVGRVQYRQGDLDGAIRTFERILADDPSLAAVVETLGRWRREAARRDRLQLAVGSRFLVAFEGDEDAAVAASALEVLERASQRIGDVLGLSPVDPVHVVLYTAAQFRDITRAPTWAAGAFEAGIIRVPVKGALARRAEFDRVLAHEYVHALVFAVAPRGVPAWLNEGLAVALQSEQPPPALAAAPTPLRTLERGFGPLSRVEAERAYATSGAAVTRLLAEAGGTAVVNLLRDLASGRGFDEAFRHRIGRSSADFEASLSTPQ